MKEKKLQTCKMCGHKTLDVSYLGKNPENGNKMFSVRCLLGCTDYIKTVPKKGKPTYAVLV